MKFRSSYFLISVIIIIAVCTGAFIWLNKHFQKVHTLKEESLTAPISAKYIPEDADLIFNWKVNPDIIPNYIGDYQDKINKNLTNKKTRLIRDSSFKLIGLDFTKEIENWVGDYGSFAILESNKQAKSNWLMVLGINEDVDIREELTSILDIDTTNNNSAIDNELSDSISTIFSKKINEKESIYIANHQEQIFIASNPETIQLSIRQSNDYSINTKNLYKNNQLKDNLNDGIFTLEISPEKILNRIGQEKNLLELNKINKLISSINIDHNQFIVEGIISYATKTRMPVKYFNHKSIDIKDSKLFDDFILIDNPYQYFGENFSHPYQKLIASVIKKSTTSDYSNLFKIILENSKGNSIWIKDKEWLFLEKKSDASKKDISAILQEENFLKSRLELKNRNVEVWSKLSMNNNEKYQIKENIGAILEQYEGTYIWGEDLSAFRMLDNIKYLANYLDFENNTEESNNFDDILRIHLGKETTETALNNFYPYILLKTMLGNSLNSPQNIDISFAVPNINYPDFIKFKVNLKTS